MNGIGVVALAMISITAACGPGEIRYDIDASLDQRPIVEQLPVAMGIYYSPEFRGYEHRSVEYIRGLEFHFIYSLGPASVALFDQVLPGMFRAVVPLKTWPSLSVGGAGLSAVLIPEIESVFIRSQHNDSDLGPFPVNVTYRFTLYGLVGDKLASWVVSGSTTYELSPVLDFQAQDKKKLAIRDALRNAAAKFVIEFPNQPDVQRWLEEKGTTTNSAKSRRQK
jgi:hypothetical protein